jgi:hypothetical protein
MQPSEEQELDVELPVPTKPRRRLSLRVQLIAAGFMVLLLAYGFWRMHQALAELTK